MGAFPKWVLDMRMKNTEIKEVRGRYYLYEVHCRYDREKKKRYKEAKYLGILVEGVGLIPKGGKEEAIKAYASGSIPGGSEISELRAEVESLKRERAALMSEIESLRGIGMSSPAQQ